MKKLFGSTFAIILSVLLMVALVSAAQNFIPVLEYPILTQVALIVVGAYVFVPVNEAIKSLIFKKLLKIN